MRRQCVRGRRHRHGRFVVVDVRPHQRARVWVNGCLDRILEPGAHGVWREASTVVEIVDAERAKVPSVIY